jgi:predicted nucleic acid-binding protein
LIVDANIILRAFFPDEQQAEAQTLVHHHILGHNNLTAPTLLLYELVNSVRQAERRERITADEGVTILTAFDNLGIALQPVAWQDVLALARQFDCSAYDAAYLALAQALGQELVTGDQRLFNAVREHLDWVRWIGENESND